MGEHVGSKRMLVALLGAVLTVAGCDGGSGPPAPAAKGDPGGPQPADIYQAQKLGMLDYAEQVVRDKCLAKAGYPQNLDALIDYRDESNYLRFSPRRYQLFSSESEADDGFGVDAPAYPGRVVSYDANYDNAMAQCESQAWASFDPAAASLKQTYEDLGSQIAASVTAKVRPVAQATLPVLIDCLQKAGYTYGGDSAHPALPDLPNHFGLTLGQYDQPASNWEPTPKPGTVQASGPTPARHWVATQQERDLAVAFYRCDQESHRLDHMWDAHYAGQAEAVSKVEAQFAELNPKLDTLAGKAATVIAAR